MSVKSIELKLGTYEDWFDGEIIVPGETLEKRLANLEAWGYQTVQFGPRTMALGWPAIRKAMANSSIKILSAHPAPLAGAAPAPPPPSLLGKDKQTRQEAVERLKESLCFAADFKDLGVIGIGAGARQYLFDPPAPPKTSYELGREILIEELKEVAPLAEKLGMFISMEPLNRYESQFIQRLDQAVDICRAVGSPNIKILADLFHENIEESDMAKALEDAAPYISLVHLADSNRFQPGVGHMNFRLPLAALKRSGYNGYMSLECRIRYREDKGKALAETARYIRKIWDEV